MSTVRLYRDDPRLVTFHATVVAETAFEDGIWVELDRTAFYPGGGGQPPDAGTLAGQPATEVTEKDGRILHRVARRIGSREIEGRIDWERRFDHMQQHTAQHLLSRILLDEYGARTIGFHIGPDVSTIDLDRSNWEASDWDAIENRLAQRIREAIPVSAREVDVEDARRMNLRKLPEGLDRVRVVSIEGVEKTACGGTHVAGTQELETVKLLGTENVGSRLRLFFIAGGRARADHRRKHVLLKRLALSISSGIDDIEAAWTRTREEAAELRKTLAARTTELLELRVRRWAEETSTDPRVVVRRLDADEADAAGAVAGRVAEIGRTVLLLGWADGQRATLLFTRSRDIDVDVRPALTRALEMLGGRGGGRPERAQGGGPRAERLDEALGEAETAVKRSLGLI